MLNFVVARKCEIMAVESLFTVALLTEGRSAQDLPKQHPDKNNKRVRLPTRVPKFHGHFTHKLHGS